MQLSRMFSTSKYKGQKGYLKTQKKYEILRTCLYFGISLSLFIAGYMAAKSRLNLLTVVAVLGCLPASKSAVSMIMFLRFSGCSDGTAKDIEKHTQGLSCLYDMVFTTYQKNYQLAHLAVRGNTICGYAEKKAYAKEKAFPEGEFSKHLDTVLRADGYKNVSVKVFTDLKKYENRLDQMKELEPENTVTEGILNVLKSVSL